MANRPEPGDPRFVPSPLSRPPGEVNNIIAPGDLNVIPPKINNEPGSSNIPGVPGAAAAAPRLINNLIATDEDFKYQYEKGHQYFMDQIVQHMLINNNLIYDAEFIQDMKQCDWNPDYLDWHDTITKWENIIAERHNSAAARAFGGRRKKRTTRKHRNTKSRKRRATKSRKHQR